MNINTWFKSKKIDNNLVHISDNGNDSIFLVIGKSHAVLIDTGLGIYDLKKYTETLTDLPVTVFNTHGHLDHCSGNYFFDITYVHPDDRSMAASRFIPTTIDFIFRTFKNVPPQDMFDFERWKLRTDELADVEEKTYDFNDFKIHSIFTPGHTRGSVCFYVEPFNYLFTGDNVVHGPTWLQLNESTDLETFSRSMLKLLPYINNNTKILSGHSMRPIKPKIAKLFPSFLGQVINNQITPVPKKTLVGKTLNYKLEDIYGVLIKDS